MGPGYLGVAPVVPPSLLGVDLRDPGPDRDGYGSERKENSFLLLTPHSSFFFRSVTGINSVEESSLPGHPVHPTHMRCS